MFRKPATWIAFVLIAGACAVFAVRNFADAFPVVTLDLRMDRAAALERARSLAEARGWGPESFRQAATFALDSQVQSFVELEGGGKAAFAEMMQRGLYQPYTWTVRHFAQGETTETRVRFTPAGEPYGFVVRLPEDEPGATLDPDAARSIAEREAVEGWDVALADWEPVEQSREEQPGGRVDHTFEYERPDARLGEGRYRLRLVVGGDRLTELTWYVKVPEAFDRRYEEMRSANNAIGAVSGVATVVLYFIGGCGVGLFFLLRRRWVVWKKAVLWGLFIALLQALATVNQWPLSWMTYDTALSTVSFTLQRVVSVVAQFAGMGVLLSVSFMAAESLTRRAFPGHLQLWRLWRAPVAGSPAVVGRTIAGYLLVGVFLAYEVALYAFAQDTLGWWTPSDALFDPDVLATWVPWLSSIATSLMAGFWEECLFRAVPLAGAALIGQRLGGRRGWIVAAMVVQALVFGSGHAAYATQPSWARVVELILPALGFGAIYLVWGLLPAIVLHFAFDVMWFALPLFVSTAPGVWVQQAFVIVLTLVPLWVVVGSRLRNGRWTEPASADLNGAWTPAPPRPAREPAPVAARPPGLSTALRGALVALGVVGLVAWGAVSDFRTDAPALPVTRAEALEAARLGLAERDVVLSEDWRALANVSAGTGLEDRFVWQEGGADVYRELMGRFIAPPRWSVRRARFEGDVAARAEEYLVFVGASGRAERVRHVLPEAAPGAELSEEDARGIARRALREIQGYDPASLKEVSADSTRQTERTDWEFVFEDPGRVPVDGAEARIGVEIAGDEVADTYRFLHVPEDWRRAERERQAVAGVIRASAIGALVVVVLGGAVAAIVVWSRGRFSPGVFLSYAAVLFVVSATTFVNGFPALSSAFSTAQPFVLQATILLVTGVLAQLVFASAIGLDLGLAHGWLPRVEPSGAAGDALAGAGLGALVAGAIAVARWAGPAPDPTWGDFGPAPAAIPAVTVAAGRVSAFLAVVAVALALCAGIDRLTAAWTRRRGLASVLLVGLGLVLAGTRGVESVPLWLVEGLVVGALSIVVYAVVIRRSWRVIPPAVGVALALASARAGIAGLYPGARLGAVLAVLAVLALSFSLARWLAGRLGSCAS